MVSAKSNRSLVVVELTGGNDCLNTVVPYDDELYYDNRPTVHHKQDEVLKLDDRLGLSPQMGPIKRLWEDGNVAVINGIGYPEPNRSHFRAMDIWHTAEPTKVIGEGWLGRAIRDLDPGGENVLTGLNLGRGLPRALSCVGVPVASVGNLETYGLFPEIQDEQARLDTLNTFSRMYGGAEGRDVVSEFIGQTGEAALKGADILRSAPEGYVSEVEYEANPFAQRLRDAAQVICADLGTRIYYAQHGSFDTHGGELPVHNKLWHEVSTAIGDFMDDLKDHGRDRDTLVLVFSEFGRRIKDNGSGTDHGSGGVAFCIGGSVEGGLYGEYPSLKSADQLQGDLHFNNDFRSTYSTILERWLGLDPAPIVNGAFEQFDFIGR